MLYSYTFLDKTHMADYTIPYTNGLQLRVILGGIMSGTARSIVETPLEFAKVLKILYLIRYNNIII